MNQLQVLDCTLRDGGYVNDWRFGRDNITRIMTSLAAAKIDIIECGFLTQKHAFDPDCSQFDTIERISEYLPADRQQAEYVCMINYGEYRLDDIPPHDGRSVDGIRVAFHKKDLAGALELCKGLVRKGYKLFLQPMVSVSYTDTEFIALIEAANQIRPYAFYIVDSFGVMKRSDLMRLYYLVDHNLDRDILVGYHSHNNIQLAYSNAQSLAEMKTSRQLIIDSSVFGMGRGAGNLNTELFIEFLNDLNGSAYRAKPLISIIDSVLNTIYLTNYWGYSLPHYLSAKHNCHPNYASYLSDKSTLVVDDIDNLLATLEPERRNDYDKNHIEQLYLAYQTHKVNDEASRATLTAQFRGKRAILVGPGSSIRSAATQLDAAIAQPDSITVAVNFQPEHLSPDYVFVSNSRRYEELLERGETLDVPLILTSNIKAGAASQTAASRLIVNYSDLTNEESAVKDNAGLMAIKLLISLGVQSILLAGFDGYTPDISHNYADQSRAIIQKTVVIEALNAGMKQMIREYSRQVPIEFIAPSTYQG
jgi:4-hydroxy 2-oxovalerate aldolase